MLRRDWKLKHKNANMMIKWKQKQKQKGNELIGAIENDVTWTQEEKPVPSSVTLIRHANKYKVYKLHQRYILYDYTV